MMKLIYMSALFFSFNAFADNESLDIEFYQDDPEQESRCLSTMEMWSCRFNTYKSCNFLLGIMHETWKRQDNYEALFPNGKLPECINNELPEAWVESKTPINKYGQTVCEIPCNIRSLPKLGTHPASSIGHINGSKEILILEKIEVTNHLNNYHNYQPWYNYWYTFMYEGKKLYIHTENVSLKE